MRPPLRAAALALLALGPLLGAALAPPAAGQGCNSIGATPVRIEVADAQPGQSPERVVTVQNPCAYGRDVTVSTSGEAGGWTRTDPKDAFRLEANAQRRVTVTVSVPPGTGPGSHRGELTFVAAAVDTGPESHVAVGVTLPLDVTVGGTPAVGFAWSGVRVPGADTAAPPVGYANVTSTGNVEAEARVRATVVPKGGGDALGQAEGTLRLRPGASGEVAVPFPAPLPEGEYVMRFEALDGSGFTAEAPLRVTVPGAPVGTLLAIVHEPRGTVGLPLRLDGRFRNDGGVEIRSARLKAEVREGTTILAVLESDALVVPIGAILDLTAHWTPDRAGTFLLVGHVVYDGRLTPDNESPVNVQGGAGGGDGPFPWWIVIAALMLLLGLVAWLVLRRRKGKEPPPTRSVGVGGRRPPP